MNGTKQCLKCFRLIESGERLVTVKTSGNWANASSEELYFCSFVCAAGARLCQWDVVIDAKPLSEVTPEWLEE